MANFMGVTGGYFYSVVILGIDKHHYWYNSEQFVGGFDLFMGVFKSVFFGGIIAMVSCYRGFHCAPGAEGVGKAATASFVYSFVLILITDLWLDIVPGRQRARNCDSQSGCGGCRRRSAAPLDRDLYLIGRCAVSKLTTDLWGDSLSLPSNSRGE
jgi:hypothetical protein